MASTQLFRSQLCAVLPFVALVWAVKAAEKVVVEEFMESYCPCSGQWAADFAQYVVPAVGNIVELRRSMDGSPHDDGSVSCFHGASECRANTLGLCAQNQTDDWQQWLNYTVCLNGPCHGPRADMKFCDFQYDVATSKGAQREVDCAAAAVLDYSQLMSCWNGTLGAKLLLDSAKYDKQTGEKYGMQGLPVVRVNGDKFSHFWDCNSHSTKLNSLITAICDAYEGSPKPSACAATDKDSHVESESAELVKMRSVLIEQRVFQHALAQVA